MRHPDDSLTQPVPTTRVSNGGTSTRLVALAVAAALLSIVWVGVDGREEPPMTRDQAKFIVPTALGRDKFAVTAVIAQRRFMGLLEERSPGELSGRYRLPLPKPDTVARFELTQLWTIDGGENYVPINAWEIPLDRMSEATPQPSVLLDVAIDGKPTQAHAPRPVRLGYSLVISAESAKAFDFVTFDLKMPTR